MISKTTLESHSGSNTKALVHERGKPCISIIVPTHRTGQDRQSDHLEIQRAITAANESLLYKPGNLSSALNSLFRDIDFNKNKEGVGIFVSQGIKKIINFPFPVTKSIAVQECFHLHDLIYMENYETVYYLLEISKKEIHLFKGMMDQLEEIKDQNFPKEITDNYEYNKPSRSNSGSGSAHVKEVERDKSILNQVRIKRIFRAIDKSLAKYIIRKDIPLLLCGPTKDVSIYKSVTGHPENIITSIGDNYKNTSIHDLEALAWLHIRSFIDKEKLKLVSEFKEKLGEGLGVFGIEKIWTATNEGRGKILLVEKDYAKKAFIAKDNRLFFGHPGEETRHCDIVDEIINTVLEKNGKVIIVEKDILKDYEAMALITRY